MAESLVHSVSKLDVLRAARALIADEAHWTQEACARDARGRARLYSEPDACKWCSVGALQKMAGADHVGRYLDALEGTGKFGTLASFNDTHTHAEVMALWDRAIAKLEAA